jgi:hypothetical protein
MAKFRLKVAHQLRHADLKTDVWLPGDKENENLGEEKGTLVGDGTPYAVANATMEMIGLDEAGVQAIATEEARLTRSSGAMNPIEQLPITLQQLFAPARDDYEDRFIPGFDGKPRPQGPR